MLISDQDSLYLPTSVPSCDRSEVANCSAYCGYGVMC